MEIKNELNPRDYRIGNWLLCANGVEFQLDSYGLFAMSEHMIDCKPLLLTEDWLLRFGFQKLEWEPVAPIWNDDIRWDLDGYSFAKDVNNKFFLMGYNWNTKHLQYVHQLQNLIFALSGQELNLSQ